MAKIKAKTKIRRYRKKHPTQFYLLFIVIVLSIFIPVAVYLRLFSLTPPEQTSNPTGYAKFYLLDAETGKKIDGKVILIDYEDPTKLYDNSQEKAIVDTGETVHITKQVYVSVYRAYTSIPHRSALPVTITPMCSNDANKPQSNTIRVHFRADRRQIDISIIKANGLQGVFDHKDFVENKNYDIRLSFTRDLPEDTKLEYPSYGHSCFVPEYLLPEINQQNDINGYGLWLLIKGTEIRYAKDADGDGIVFEYIDSLGGTIILLDMFFGEEDTQDISFELLERATGFVVFQGFLDDFSDTKIIIG